MRTRPVILILSSALLVACGSSGGGTPVSDIIQDVEQPASCSVGEQNQFVDDVMRDIYFWLDELPALDPQSFSSPEALLDALRFDPPDRFSSIRDAAADTAFFSASQFVGVGIGLHSEADSQLFVTEVFADGPAAAAGFLRGDELLAINGEAVADVLAGQGISAAFGSDEVGTPVTLRFRDLAGAERMVDLAKAVVTIETVPVAQILDADGRSTAYLAFRDFVDPSVGALENAFAEFARQQVDELVLDLRYNGGGLLSVAQQLSDLIGGVTAAGQVQYVRAHNRLNRDLDETVQFAARGNSLALQRAVVIVAPGTASASELVINSLRPFLDVVLIGDQTLGKPVGSFGFTFCDKVVHPIAFDLRNADGVGEYFDGLEVDCAAVDDLGHALGDPEEASLAEALHYLSTGACSLEAQLRAARQLAKPTARVPRQYGYRELLGGAY